MHVKAQITLILQIKYRKPFSTLNNQFLIAHNPESVCASESLEQHNLFVSFTLIETMIYLFHTLHDTTLVIALKRTYIYSMYTVWWLN